MEAFKMPNILS